MKRDRAGLCSLGLREIQHHELWSLLVINWLRQVAGLWTIRVQVHLQQRTCYSSSTSTIRISLNVPVHFYRNYTNMLISVPLTIGTLSWIPIISTTLGFLCNWCFMTGKKIHVYCPDKCGNYMGKYKQEIENWGISGNHGLAHWENLPLIV